MKKKRTLLLLSISSVFAITSLGACRRSSFVGKVYLDYGEIRENPLENITELSELTYNKLKSKLSTNESFLLVLFNATCSCWGDFQPVITRYINETNVKVEYINVDEFAGESETFGLFYEKINMPSVALFKRGSLVRQEYLGNDELKNEMFRKYASFKQWADENIVLPKMYYVSKDVLDGFIADDLEFNLYIARSECHDCQNVNYNVLYDFSDNLLTTSKPLYIFDIQQYRGTEIYQDIKDMYGLSPVNNPILGYELYDGAVPTFQHRRGAAITDMITVLNDTVNQDSKTVYSYFTQARVDNMPFLKNSSLTAVLNGMQLTDEQFDDWRSYSSTYYKDYHYPILKLFLNSYIA